MQLLGYARDGKLGIASAEPIFPATLARSSGDCSELVLYTTRDHNCISDRIGSGIRNCPRCRCRLATSGALPTPSAIDRTIIMLNDRRFWGHASGPPNRQVRRSIVSSIIGTPMPPAAAPYRASGLVQWQETDMATVFRDVRLSGAKQTWS